MLVSFLDTMSSEPYVNSTQSEFEESALEKLFENMPHPAHARSLRGRTQQWSDFQTPRSGLTDLMKATFSED